MKKFFALFVAAASALALSVGISSCSNDKDEPSPDPDPIDVELATSLFLGEEETALNTHSEVSVEAFNAIAVKIIGAPYAVSVDYALFELACETGGESSSWVIADGAAPIVEGSVSINGIYSELEESVVLLAGHKYQLAVCVTIGNSAAPQVIAAEEYVINGATPVTVNTSLFNGEEEIALNDHSEVPLEQFSAIAVSPENAPYAVSVDYALFEMALEAGEESSSWVIADGAAPIVEGTMNINGIAYAEFEEPVVLLVGHKYQLSIVVNGGNPATPQVIAEECYIINGASEEPLRKSDMLGTYTGTVVNPWGMTINFNMVVADSVDNYVRIYGFDPQFAEACAQAGFTPVTPVGVVDLEAGTICVPKTFTGVRNSGNIIWLSLKEEDGELFYDSDIIFTFDKEAGTLTLANAGYGAFEDAEGNKAGWFSLYLAPLVLTKDAVRSARARSCGTPIPFRTELPRRTFVPQK